MAERYVGKFKQEIQQMMYVAGETVESSSETLTMVEEIVQAQIHEMLRTATELANRRGSNFISNNDLIFQIRHDTAKVLRLRGFLSWKDMHKNMDDAESSVTEENVAFAVRNGLVDDAMKRTNTKPKDTLPWHTSSIYGQAAADLEPLNDDDEAINDATVLRLRKADERTKDMTKEEYMEWAEYRHASFTWRKVQRFRDWAGLGVIADNKPSADIVEILGFLIYEMIQTITEEGLAIQNVRKGVCGIFEDAEAAKNKETYEQGDSFVPSTEARTPLSPQHIQQAFFNLQTMPKKSLAMQLGTRSLQKRHLKLF